ncbi:hypothetical protein PIB30_055290 [Stylosanthes scabra]|uniref:Uncharacterized protein n=1 Tax=Stylosanthes scabra TaxID=79078 RepID=A0ABU6WLU0_9FABA|nr:hypothetical protein [Stylosanthes scabra]
MRNTDQRKKLQGSAIVKPFTCLCSPENVSPVAGTHRPCCYRRFSRYWYYISRRKNVVLTGIRCGVTITRRQELTVGALETSGRYRYSDLRSSSDHGVHGSVSVEDAFIAELKRLQEERLAIIEAEGPEPPDRRRRDPDDDDTTSGPPNLREQVTLLNKEISQQAEAHAQRVVTVEAICAEKVRTLESTVMTQSQKVFELRKAYSDMYSFLT